MARSRSSRDAGFTLIELLVVLLIIGVLAAIALPMLTEQSKKGQDVEAQTLARELATHARACRAEARTWSACDSAGEVLAKTKLTWGTEPGQVQVLVDPMAGVEVAFIATSKTRTVFALVNAKDDSTMQKVCYVPSNAYPTGKCRQGGPVPGFGRW